MLWSCTGTRVHIQHVTIIGVHITQSNTSEDTMLMGANECIVKWGRACFGKWIIEIDIEEGEASANAE